MTSKLNPQVQAFFDAPTWTVTYVVYDRVGGHAAIIDSVLNYDHKSGRTSTRGADELMAFVNAQGLRVQWILETHAHADHLSAAPYLRQHLGGRIGIGAGIDGVQKVFKGLFNLEPEFKTDGSQFDHLFADGDTFTIGSIKAHALHTPGHTPACMTYVIGDAGFVGDTLFMPDYGTARCDFPGGSAHTLYQSIRKLFSLPGETRLFMCHDYKAPGRDDYRFETTVAEERAHNVHVHEGISEEDFVAMRSKRDATLGMPTLILPSVQVNMRAGQLPPAEENGTRYLKIPLDVL